MASMFHGATSFNGDISNWDVSRVRDMGNMFHDATSFKQDISTWKVSSVMSMRYMFYGATSFDKDISEWDVSRVMNMNWMFYRTPSFSRALCGTAWANSEAQKEHMFTQSAGRICFGLGTPTQHAQLDTLRLHLLSFCLHELSICYVCTYSVTTINTATLLITSALLFLLQHLIPERN